jgi:hypothetical protein
VENARFAKVENHAVEDEFLPKYYFDDMKDERACEAMYDYLVRSN